METVEERFEQLLTLLPKFQLHAEKAIEKAADLIVNAFANGNKILICGNGGSAADSQHFAAEFVNAFSRKISRKALPAIALSTDTSVITSISNDFTFDEVFSRQVEAYAMPGDVLVVFTTSGSSINCIKAVESAKIVGVSSIAFSQVDAEISKLVDLCIEVPSYDTQRIQECHILAYHVIAELVEDSLFGDLK